MKKNRVLLGALCLGLFCGNHIINAMEVPADNTSSTASTDRDEFFAAMFENVRDAHWLISLLTGLEGHVRIVMVKHCEDSSMPMPLAKKQVRCFVCKSLYDDLERIAVLPCGDTLCCKCADRVLSCRKQCPVCKAMAGGYRSKPYILEVECFRNDSLEMPLLQKDCNLCSICLEDFEDCKDIALLPCGHAFCPRCIDHALTLNRQCPFCRAAASGYRVRKFFVK